MKIKTKKQLNLPQLIEWAWSNNVKNAHFKSKGIFTGGVTFDRFGRIDVKEKVDKGDLFTVEVEEEITEDTVIPRIVELDLCGYDQHEDLFIEENKSINQILNEDEVKNKAFYILNDDLTMTLIWTHDKGLVE